MSDRGGAGTADKKDKQVIMELNVTKLQLKVSKPTKLRIEWVRGTSYPHVFSTWLMCRDQAGRDEDIQYDQWAERATY